MCRVMDDPCALLRECGLIPSGWQLVVAADPPSDVRIWASACAGGGGSFHEAAGSRSLRRFIIRPAGVLLLPAMVAGVFSRSARAGCVRAGRGFEVRYGSID